MPTTYLVFTLDSHDHFGPFETNNEAHAWAKAIGLRSYSIETSPIWQDAVVRKPFRPLHLGSHQ